MYINEDVELVKLILEGNEQDVIDVYSSKAYGWIDKCISLSPSEIEDVVESLNLSDSDSAAIICHTLEAVLDDIDEHAEYSENSGNKEGIKKRIAELKNRIQQKNDYEWGYLRKVAAVVEDGHTCFAMEARKKMTEPKQIDFLKAFEDAKRVQRPDILMNTTNFSFMNTLLDEAILSELSHAINYGALNSSSDEEKLEAEKSFYAFEYYISERPLPLCFGTYIIDKAILLAARWGNQDFANKVIPYIDRIIPNVNTYASLAAFYATFNNREKLIESLKLAEQYGSDGDFGWSRYQDNAWENDNEVQNLIPKSIFDYPLDDD